MFEGSILSYQLLLITRQKSRLRNEIENNSSTDKKLSKIRISKIIHSRLLLNKIESPLMKVEVPLKHFSSISNNSCISNKCRNSKKYMVLEQ